MNKLKIGFIFGGTSTESYISIISATSTLKELDKKNMKYFQFILGKMENGINI